MLEGNSRCQPLPAVANTKSHPVATESPCMAVSLETWMAELPNKDTATICELALPGAHNAGATKVEYIPSDVLSTYVGETVAKSWLVQLLAKPVAKAPAVCQSESIHALLRGGIRLLDLRLGLHKQEIHICHTVVCSSTFRTVLSEVREFLQDHPEELVVLLIKRDWEHQGFDTADNWSRVQEILKQELGALLMEKADMRLPVSQLVKQNRRVLAMVELPINVPLLCGVRRTDQNVIYSWSPKVATVADQMSRITTWCRNGTILPQPGYLKLLELALPGNPRASAPELQATFRDFLKSSTFGPLHVATKIDFPETETVQEIVKMNWIPPKVQGSGYPGS